MTPTFYPYRLAHVFPILGTEDERLVARQSLRKLLAGQLTLRPKVTPAARF